MLKKLSRFILTVGLVTTLTACGSEANSSTIASLETEWPTEITLVNTPNATISNDAPVHNALRDHLEQELGVEVRVFEHHSEDIESLVNDNFDIMLANPVSYYHVDQLAGAELLATLKTEGDDYSAFITRRDKEDILSVEDLDGKSFAFVTEDSSSGFLYPKGTLVQMLDLDSDLVEQSGYFFSRVIFTESHENSVLGVLSGDFDAAVVAISQLEHMINTGMIQGHEFKLIGRTPDIPDTSYIVRKNLPEHFKQAMREAFVSFDNERYFESFHNDPYARFVPPVEHYYESAIEMLSTINALESHSKEFIMID